MAVNVLYLHCKEEGKSKGKITIFQRSHGNTSQSKVVNLLLITDGEKRHYTSIKILSRVLRRENSKQKGAYYTTWTACRHFTQAVQETRIMLIASITIFWKQRSYGKKKISMCSTMIDKSSSRYRSSCMQISRASWNPKAKRTQGESTDMFPQDGVQRLYSSYLEQLMIPLTEVM